MLKQPTQDLRYIANDEGSEGLGVAWAELSLRSADHAPCAAPELVLPFLKRAHVASVYAQDHLVLAMPLQRGRLVDSSHHSPVSDCGLCHADRLNGPAAVSLLLSKCRQPILLKSIPVQSQFYAMMENAAGHFAVLQKWQRAGLEVKGSYDGWLSRSLDPKRRKELKRLRNRLNEQGDLKLAVLQPDGSAAPFIASFLELEAAGWKGKSGTALGSEDDLAATTHKALAALHQVGKLRFWSLKLGERTIASLFAYVDGNKANLGKIAHDEAYGKYSPGSLLVLDATESIFNEGSIIEVDSSAVPGHPMIDHLWRDRLGFADIMVAPASVSTLRFGVIVMTERMRSFCRAALKSLYHLLTGKSRS